MIAATVPSSRKVEVKPLNFFLLTSIALKTTFAHTVTYFTALVLPAVDLLASPAGS